MLVSGLTMTICPSSISVSATDIDDKHLLFPFLDLDCINYITCNHASLHNQ